MKNIYNPDEEDILDWTRGDLKWPANDWDGYVMGSECDSLILSFANIKECKNEKEEYLRRFFTVVLYYFVGNHYQFWSDSDRSIMRLNNLLNSVDDNSSDLLREWKKNTINLMNGNLEYVNNFWFNNKLIYT